MAPPYTGIGSLEVHYIVKVMAFLVLSVYYLMAATGLNTIFPIATRNTEAQQKEFLLSRQCIALLGGSNVLMGLSAELITSNNCKAINAGIDYELGGFRNYVQWFGSKLKSDITIYSPAAVWSEGNLTSVNTTDIAFRPPALLSQLKAYFLRNGKTDAGFNAYGDLLGYSCLNMFSPMHIDKIKFEAANIEVVIEIVRRTEAIMMLTHFKKVYLRIPPIFSEGKDAEGYRILMNRRIELLKEKGIEIIGTSTVVRNRELFCDASHPNLYGREVFSKELRDRLYSPRKNES